MWWMTTTPGCGPSARGRATYASISSPPCPGRRTVSAIIASYTFGAPCYRMRGAPYRAARGGFGSDAEQVAGPGVGGRVAQLRHGPGLDLADALPGEVEHLAHLLEGAGLPPVQSEAEAEDL